MYGVCAPCAQGRRAQELFGAFVETLGGANYYYDREDDSRYDTPRIYGRPRDSEEYFADEAYRYAPSSTPRSSMSLL